MRFLVGDDTGILKWVRVEAQKVERLGKSQRGDAAERLCWAGSPFEREERVAVGYASGAVEVRDATSGEVHSTAYLGSPGIRCLEVLGGGDGGGDLLAVAQSGAAGIVRGWCEEDAPAPLPEEVANPSADNAGAASAGAKGSKAKAGADAVRRFELPGPIKDAKADPLRSERLVFGGGENDVKLWDIAKSEVTWRAKNVRENALCLRVPVKVSCLQWASQLAPSRSLVLCGTTDGKVRLYDVNAQRRPLFELVVGHGAGAGTGGYTGTVDETARPLNCSAIASVRGDAWSLFVGNTMGVLREYDLRNLSSCGSAPFPPGRKAHLNWAAKQMPFRRGYRGIMGSIRSVDVHCSGEALAAVGIGRFAYVFETRKKRMTSKVYLKQKLCSVLMSAEEYKTKEESDAEASDDDGSGEAGEGAGEGAEGSDDEVVEGFSDDEAAEPRDKGSEDEEDDVDSGDDCEGEEEEDDESEEDETPVARKGKASRKEVVRQQTTVIMPDAAENGSKKRSRQKAGAGANGAKAAPKADLGKNKKRRK